MPIKRPPEMQALFDMLERGGPFASIEEANRVMQKRMREYNARPQSELGGLSPDAMGQLLDGDWMSQGALRLVEDLAPEDVAGSVMLADARTLLEFVGDEGPVKETAAHNLPRAAVAALRPRLRIVAQRDIEFDPRPPAPMNEGDVWWLADLRHVLLFGGLLVRRKGLRITPLGRALLSPEREGELYALLFRTLFRKFDLRALDRFGDHPGLQSTLAFSFYKLRSEARDWTPSVALARTSWLDSAKDPMNDWQAAHGDFRHISFQIRVLEPLAYFALLEERQLATDEPWRKIIEYRCTPLFGRFLRFEFRGG